VKLQIIIIIKLNLKSTKGQTPRTYKCSWKQIASQFAFYDDHVKLVISLSALYSNNGSV